MYVFLGLLILLLLYSLQDREPFTVHIEGGVDVITPIQESVQTITRGFHERVSRPMYTTVMGFIPYKHHYRRLRRHLSK